MTPLQIEILLWYRTRANDYRDGDFSAPAVDDAMVRFVKQTEMLTEEFDGKPRKFRLTERGQAFVTRLCETPLPTCKWVFEGDA